MSVTAFTITGSNGDEAEATDLPSALVAARTLVDDGNDTARVLGPTGVWVATARMTTHGVSFHLIQGVAA